MSHMHYKTQFVPFVRDREHEHGMTASAGSEQSQSYPMLSPNVAKRGIPKDLTLERAFHDTLPESSPSLQPSGGTSQGRDSVWLFSKPCWFSFMNFLVSLWTHLYFLNPQHARAKSWSAEQHVVWFYLKPHLLSEPSICQHHLMLLYWHNQRQIPRHSFLFVILMTSVRPVSPRWWSIPLQFFHLQSSLILWNDFFSPEKKGIRKS